jgi:cell division protein FtsN
VNYINMQNTAGNSNYDVYQQQAQHPQPANYLNPYQQQNYDAQQQQQHKNGNSNNTTNNKNNSNNSKQPIRFVIHGLAPASTEKSIVRYLFFHLSFFFLL